MSGGHWDYLGFKLETKERYGGRVWHLLAQFEHELDWGYSGDTCLTCAERRVAKALAAYFDTACEDIGTALALARDGLQNRCDECNRRSTVAGVR